MSLSCGDSQVLCGLRQGRKSRSEWVKWAEQHTERVLQRPDPRKPSVRLLQVDGGRVLLKDFFHLGCGPKRWVAAALVANEARSYRKLFWIPGVPQMFARPTSDSLLLEYIPGRPVHQIGLGELPLEAVQQARTLVTSLHLAGVTHGDLGHDFEGDFGRDTNLIWNGERLFVVDFAGSLHMAPWNRGLFDTYQKHDRLVVTKLLRRFFPDRPDLEGYDWDQALSAWQWRMLRWLKKV